MLVDHRRRQPHFPQTCTHTRVRPPYDYITSSAEVIDCYQAKDSNVLKDGCKLCSERVWLMPCSDVASETVTECAMIAREMKARQRALLSILCERVSTSLIDSLTQDFVAEFGCSIAQDVIRYTVL